MKCHGIKLVNAQECRTLSQMNKAPVNSARFGCFSRVFVATPVRRIDLMTKSQPPPKSKRPADNCRPLPEAPKQVRALQSFYENPQPYQKQRKFT